MNNGLGLYSPHATTVFLLKTLLMSLWIGFDVIAVMAFFLASPGLVFRHGVLVFLLSAILVSGTFFSALCGWAAGSLFGLKESHAEAGGWLGWRYRLQSNNASLARVGITCTGLVMLPIACSLFWYGTEHGKDVRVGSSTVETARKCAEIASLEQQIFNADTNTVMAECLLQYDGKYAALRNKTQQK